MKKEEANQKLKQIKTISQFRTLASEMRASGLDFYSRRTGALAFHFIAETTNKISYLYDQKRTTSALRGSSLIKNLHRIMKIY